MKIISSPLTSLDPSKTRPLPPSGPSYYATALLVTLEIQPNTCRRYGGFLDPHCGWFIMENPV